MQRILIVLAALIAAGCAPVSLTPQEMAQKKAEPVPGKAVVYVVQNPQRDYSAGLRFDDGTQIRTWPGTFYRWVTTAGTHRIVSDDPSLSARITLQVEAGKVYFVEHKVTGIRGSTTDATLQSVSEGAGRQLLALARPCCDVR
jgi:hypothetical protein